jgi:hypothetical protein
MKWLRTLVLFDKGDVISSTDWKAVHEATSAQSRASSIREALAVYCCDVKSDFQTDSFRETASATSDQISFVTCKT